MGEILDARGATAKRCIPNRAQNLFALREPSASLWKCAHRSCHFLPDQSPVSVARQRMMPLQFRTEDGICR